eukprot:scaffold1173_cov405-Prasinococcus_capsulatus_cf.AAC.20
MAVVTSAAVAPSEQTSRALPSIANKMISTYKIQQCFPGTMLNLDRSVQPPSSSAWVTSQRPSYRISGARRRSFQQPTAWPVLLATSTIVHRVARSKLFLHPTRLRGTNLYVKVLRGYFTHATPALHIHFDASASRRSVQRRPYLCLHAYYHLRPPNSDPRGPICLHEASHVSRIRADIAASRRCLGTKVLARGHTPGEPRPPLASAGCGSGPALGRPTELVEPRLPAHSCAPNVKAPSGTPPSGLLPPTRQVSRCGSQGPPCARALYPFPRACPALPNHAGLLGMRLRAANRSSGRYM